MNLQLSLATALAQSLLHSLWQLTLIAGVASLGFNALAKATARARHLLGLVCLLAMLLAPLATFMACWQPPTLAVSGDAGWLGAAAAETSAAPAAAAVPSWHDWLWVALSQLWLLGVAAMALRQFGGWLMLGRIEAQSFIGLPPHWQARADALAAAMGIGRRVSVRLAQHVVSPFTTHVLRPVIWLPLALLTQLPASHIEALLAHELAHIRRLDWYWNALQCAAEGLLFHHPAMWWLSRRIREEREHACDDLAVAACGDAIALAEALAGLQRAAPLPMRPHRLAGSDRMPMPALAARGGSLLKRVEHLLAGAPRPANWRATAMLGFVACCAALVALQLAPPAHLLTNLHVDASTSGELAPGEHREYTATYLGEKTRRYRISMDMQGRVDERYSEGGEDRPIDTGVRAWLAAMTAMDGQAPAPAPALPAVRKPAPPQPPAMSDEATRLMALLSAEPRLLALTGQPAYMDRPSFHGQIHTWGARDFHLWGIDDPVGGKASFTATFAGPNGRAQVRYSGRTVKGGDWVAERLDVQSLPN